MHALLSQIIMHLTIPACTCLPIAKVSNIDIPISKTVTIELGTTILTMRRNLINQRRVKQLP